MFNRIWKAWKKFGHWMGDRVARVLLTIFYFTLALPFGLLVRLTQDPLDVRSKSADGWVKKHEPDVSINSARRRF